MKKILILSLLTISCSIPTQNLIAAHRTTNAAYPVALDLHDTVLERDYSIAIDVMLKKASWRDLGCFLWGVICFGIEKKILRRQTPNIENYLLKSNLTQKTLPPAQLTANQAYEQHVVRTISCFKPMAGAEKFLRDIKAQGHPIFAFSNIGHKSFELLAQQYPEVMGQFDGRIIVEDSTTPDKSKPAAYQRCLDIITDTIGTKPEKVIFYDDSSKKLNLAEQFRATKITIDSNGKTITTTEPKSRFIPVLCQSGSPTQIAASRALLLTKLAEARDDFNPDKLRTID